MMEVVVACVVILLVGFGYRLGYRDGVESIDAFKRWR